MECLLDGERLIETLPWQESPAVAADQRAGALEGREIRPDRDRGGGEPPRQRHYRDASALLQQVANPPPPLLHQQSFLHRILRRAQVGVRFTAGIEVVHGSFDRAPCVKVHKALPCRQMRVPELAITYDTGHYRFDTAHQQAYLDRYAIF